MNLKKSPIVPENARLMRGEVCHAWTAGTCAPRKGGRADPNPSAFPRHLDSREKARSDLPATNPCCRLEPIIGCIEVILIVLCVALFGPEQQRSQVSFQTTGEGAHR